MERTDKNIALNKGNYKGINGHCIEESRWPQNLNVDYDDEELVAFYEHAEVCPVHGEMVRDANSDLSFSLIQFNCRLRASMKPKHDSSVLQRMRRLTKQNNYEIGMQASGTNDLD